MEILKKAMEGIGVLDEVSMKRAQERLDSLTKPRGSLGSLGRTGGKGGGYKKRCISPDK